LAMPTLCCIDMHMLHEYAEDAAPWARLLTTRDVAALMRVDKSTVYRMAEDGRLPAVKVGRQWRFPEDRLLEWLGSGRSPAAGMTGAAGEQHVLITPEAGRALSDLLGDLLGVMVVLTDMAGRPLAEAGNPCGLFTVAHRYPGVLERCISGWREMADEPDLEPRWRDTPLGFLCARTLVRVGDRLQGMILVGGIAPARWPPAPEEVRRLAAALGVPVEAIAPHLEQVHRLDPEQQERVLRMLPRLGALMSRLAEAADLPADPGERATRSHDRTPQRSKQ